MTYSDPEQNTEGAEIPDVLTRRQNREEAALVQFKDRARKVIDRYTAELEQDDPDLSERRTMAGLVMAKIDSSSTEREVTSALKILQGTFGHTVQQHQVTHTHLTLEARLETGIAAAKRMGFIQDAEVVDGSGGLPSGVSDASLPAEAGATSQVRLGVGQDDVSKEARRG